MIFCPARNALPVHFRHIRQSKKDKGIHLPRTPLSLSLKSIAHFVLFFQILWAHIFCCLMCCQHMVFRLYLAFLRKLPYYNS